MTVDATAVEHTGPELCVRGDFRVLDCECCGFPHVVPLPSEEELAEVYAHDYYATEKPLYLERVEQDRPFWDRLHGRRLERVAALLRADGRRLLDVGSGPGLLLERARACGWDELGVEPSRQAAAHARSLGVGVREAFLDDALAAELLAESGGFDCVHAAEVLEHLPDPRAMVRRMRSLLKPGGVLVLSVPNDFNPFQRTLAEVRGFAPWWVAPPHHLNYFDFASLERLLVAEGFETLERETSFPIDLFLLMGDDYTADDALGRACHAKRMAFEAALVEAGRAELLEELYGALADLGLGRHAVVYARRPDGLRAGC